MSDSTHKIDTVTSSSLTRRSFLKRTAQAGAILIAPTIIPASVLGREGAVSPNEKIILGGLGVGGRGTFDLRHMLRQPDVQFVAICDAKKSQREAIKQLADSRYDNSDCAMYHDMRQFLAERTDIDALLIATGDRWHATAAAMAMRAGKDVYSEKPSSMTIAEGQAVVDTAKRYNRVYQTGVQRLSEQNFVFANEALRLGRLGKIQTVRAQIAPGGTTEMRFDWLPEEPQPPKEEMNWDQWLGPCPWRPFNSAYISGGWRDHYDFHTSCIGEWGAHTIAQCQVAIGQANTSAIEFGYVDNKTGEGMNILFSNGIKMVLNADVDKKYWHGSCGVRYEGEEGWIAIADAYQKPDVSDPKILADFDKIISDYAERTGRPVNAPKNWDDAICPMGHVRDFFDCIRSRKTTIANPAMMHNSMTTIHAANPCRQYLHVAETRYEIQSPQARIYQRSRCQPPAYPGATGTVDYLTPKKNPPSFHRIQPME